MTFLANSLWELVGPVSLNGRTHRSRRRAKPVVGLNGHRPLQEATHNGQSRQTMQQKYDAIVEEMKGKYEVRVRKWRNSSSGLAWEVRYRDGRVRKFIESPYPRGPMSVAIFLHEIGHHAIGLGHYRPRCLEEYHVWVWAIQTMREKGLNVTPAVERRVERSMQYAVGKATRRGIRQLPPELVRYT